MRDAFEPLDARGCCFFVLTLDRLGTYSGEKKWDDAQSAYRDLGKLSTAFMWRLRRWMTSMGWRPLHNQWVQTVEMHKSGWPHVNLIIWSTELAEWIESETNAKLDDHLDANAAKLVSRELADIVTQSGWGIMSTAERAQSAEAVMGYITKTSGKVEESLGELAKLTQLPNAAPFRFRRLRSGKGFLPKRIKNEELTGTLVRRQNSNDGTRDVVPLHNVAESRVEPSEECCATEERIWIGELETAHRCKRQVKQFGMRAVEVPPVTHWFRKQRLAQGPRNRREESDARYLFRPEEVLLQSTA